jgi:hypothetical protein
VELIDRDKLGRFIRRPERISALVQNGPTEPDLGSAVNRRVDLPTTQSLTSQDGLSSPPRWGRFRFFSLMLDALRAKVGFHGGSGNRGGFFEARQFSGWNGSKGLRIIGRNSLDTLPQEHQGATMTGKITIGLKWHQQSEAAKSEAQKLPPGKERDALTRKARQLQTASQINQWLSSSELQPPK